jgi:hypothetical protein
MELLDYFNQIFQRTGKPIQFPDNKDIALPVYTDALRQFGSFLKCAGKFFLENLLSPSFIQSIHLEIRVLVLGANTRITYDHQTNLFWS